MKEGATFSDLDHGVQYRCIGKKGSPTALGHELKRRRPAANLGEEQP